MTKIHFRPTPFALCLTLLLCLSLAVGAQTVMSDATYRQKTNQVFQDKIQLIGSQFYTIDDAQLTDNERDALHFLYAYMSVADATDYATDFYLANVRASMQASREMTWGQSVPELLFRHFVLPVRVNNENLDLARIVFYKELKNRVKGLSMQQAILEINHWCHEHVTYQPSDGRTLSPLACVKTAIGRCGEESTFTVAALRAMGIPARQVYTPRWAHTDDNHAWVEAWADGKWWFLGACEPEAVLNLGWFNAPASRAMLMHTRVFGDYDGPEEVMLRTSNFTEINLIDNYGSSARIDFVVSDRKGKRVDNARVDFKIYNYAEFCTVASKYTDKKGQTFLTAGKGDMLVWASKDGWYGFTKASFGKDKKLTIKLQHNAETTKSLPQEALDVVPPVERALLPPVPEALQQQNKQRLAYEDSLRKAYESTFLTQNEAEAICPQAANMLVKARGNWTTILQFVNEHAGNPTRAINLLKSLSDKDLRDMPSHILEDIYNGQSNELCPRVENEMIILPFRQTFEKAFPTATANRFRQDPSLLVKWVKDSIRLNPDPKALRIAQTPIGVWRSRVTDRRSRDIFFVDMARSLGIEARKDVVTQKVQYRQNGQWTDVDFDAAEQKAAPTGRLALTWPTDGRPDDPKYYSHFTVTRIRPDGTTQLMNFDEGQVDMGGGTSWSNTFRDGATLDEGNYLLTTGTRLASGSVLATNQVFHISADQTTTLPLTLRQSDTELSVIGNFDSESKFRLVNASNQSVGDNVSILSQTGRGYFVVGLLGMGQEPTNHALRDIAKERKQLDEWGRPMLLLFENEEDMHRFFNENLGQMPQNTIYGIDADGSIHKQIAAQMKLANASQKPIFIVSDTFNRVVFCSQGYTIGLGEQLVKVSQKL